MEGLFHTIEDMSMFTYEFLGGVGVGVGGVSIEGGVGDGFCGGQFGKGSKESLSLSPTISLPSSSSESSFFFAEVPPLPLPLPPPISYPFLSFPIPSPLRSLTI